MPRSALAGGIADGMCHIDQRSGRLHIPLRMYRRLSVVARAFLLEGVSLAGWYWPAFFCPLFRVGVCCLQARRATVHRLGTGGEYRAVYGQDVV